MFDSKKLEKFAYESLNSEFCVDSTALFAATKVFGMDFGEEILKYCLLYHFPLAQRGIFFNGSKEELEIAIKRKLHFHKIPLYWDDVISVFKDYSQVPTEVFSGNLLLEVTKENVEELKRNLAKSTAILHQQEKIFHIWAEGYSATGDRGRATYVGKSVARTFNEAVKAFIKEHPTCGIETVEYTDEKAYLESKSHWHIWGCRLFDNEADARASYG